MASDLTSVEVSLELLLYLARSEKAHRVPQQNRENYCL